MSTQRVLAPSQLPPGTRLVVFDVDGTLYDQRRLRRRMARELLRHLAWSAPGRRKIGIVRSFRRVRESLAEREVRGIRLRQYEACAQLLGIPADEIRAVTHEWLERRPLPFLAGCREPGTRELFGALRDAGITIGVLSDYPAHEKLTALGLAADVVVCATDPEVDVFKPLPTGLQAILRATSVAPSQAVMIGDRVERDGACAERCGVHFVLKTGSMAHGGPGSFLELARSLDERPSPG